MTEITVIALAVIGGFAVLATFTPNTDDDKVLDFILKLINVLGANVGNARNSDGNE